jgi:RNA polymerase sigma-54 factor
MKYFFTSGYQTASGESVSNKSVKDRIAQMIANENPAAPLSDQAITDKLKAEGLPVARRTVAKYREELKIMPSHMRKEV